ncbi:MAG: methyltransferase [Chloroflexota bacterium]
MASETFEFKQFTIEQDQCAMKVSTDGVLLGAWTDISDIKTVLDIGTGTGLIALMLAQKLNTHPTASMDGNNPTFMIDAIEIESTAAKQASENMAKSPWGDQIHVHACSLQSYLDVCQTTYDLIVSNPPFFENAMWSPSLERTMARHADILTTTDLLDTMEPLLNDGGRLCVIYPTKIADYFQREGERRGYLCTRKLAVKPKPNTPAKRVMLELMKPMPHTDRTADSAGDTREGETMVLEHSRHIYSSTFIDMTRDFYLSF